MDRDPYRILQVSRTADQRTIQAAYRRLARAYHPDLNSHPDAAERMRDINWAYDLLKDPHARRQYDYFHTSAAAGSAGTSSGHSQAAPPSARNTNPGPQASTAARPSAQNQPEVNHNRATSCWGTVLLVVIINSIIAVFRNAAPASPNYPYSTLDPARYSTLEAAITSLAATPVLTQPKILCIPWSRITIEDAGEQVCIYGEVAHVQASQGRYYTTFGSGAAVFSMVSDQQKMKTLAGTCVQAVGTIEVKGSLLVMTVEDQEIHACGSQPEKYILLQEK